VLGDFRFWLAARPRNVGPSWAFSLNCELGHTAVTDIGIRESYAENTSLEVQMMKIILVALPPHVLNRPPG
jgi:hypothetical protein